MTTYQVRGPDPDGDWFIVEIDGDEATAIDETFATEGAAQAAADRLNQPTPPPKHGACD